MRYALMVTAALASLLGSVASAGLNPDFTLPLHARAGFLGCTAQPVANCTTVPVNTTVEAGGTATIYFMLANFVRSNGVQLAYVWPNDWLLADCFGECRSGQICPFFCGCGPDPSCNDPDAPPGHCGGPTQGRLATVFNCFTPTGAAIYIGRLQFEPVGAGGCFSIIEPHPNFPHGIHVIDCQQGHDQIQPNEIMRLGRICVGSGGHDACPRVVPVETATWGNIKSSYR